jgi:hypothetical protein
VLDVLGRVPLTGLPFRHRLITSRTAAPSTPMIAAIATFPHHHLSASLHFAVHSSGWLDRYALQRLAGNPIAPLF